MADVRNILVILFMTYLCLLNVLYQDSDRGHTEEYWRHPRGFDWLYYPLRRSIMMHRYRSRFSQKLARILSLIGLVAVFYVLVLYVPTLLTTP